MASREQPHLADELDIRREKLDPAPEGYVWERHWDEEFENPDRNMPGSNTIIYTGKGAYIYSLRLATYADYVEIGERVNQRYLREEYQRTWEETEPLLRQYAAGMKAPSKTASASDIVDEMLAHAKAALDIRGTRMSREPRHHLYNHNLGGTGVFLKSRTKRNRNVLEELERRGIGFMTRPNFYRGWASQLCEADTATMDGVGFVINQFALLAGFEERSR